MQKNFSKKHGGFTLLEMIVSLAVFSVALFIATSTFLSVVNSDRKSHSTRIATDNLNLTLEDMSRRIKTGLNYNCSGNAGVADCVPTTNPSSIIAFDDQTGTRIVYKRGVGSGAIVGGTSASGCGTGAGYGVTQGCILRSDGGAAFLPITSQEIDITALRFFVVGSALYTSGDRNQPTIVVAVDGSLGNQTSTKVSFKMQTTITQRAYDH